MSIFFRFLKRIFVPIFNILKYFGCFIINKKYFSIYQIYSNNTKLFIGIIYILLAIIFYFFISNITVSDAIQILIFTIISFAFSTYISDKFKYSNILYIKILQKFVFIFIKFCLAGLFICLFNIYIFNSSIFCDSDDEETTEELDTTEEEENNNKNNKEINKDVTHKGKGKEVVRVSTSTDDKEEEYYDFSVKNSTFDSGVNTLKEGVKALVTDLAPNIGIGAAAGKAASEVIKQTSGMAPVPKAGLILLATTAAALGTGIGISAVEAVRQNSSVLENSPISSSSASGSTEIINKNKGVKSNSEAAQSEGVNAEGSILEEEISLTNMGISFIIPSILDDSEIPLIILVNSLHILNYLEFSLIFSLFSLLFRKYFYIKLNRIIVKLLNNKDAVTLTKVSHFMDKYTEYIILYLFICLIWLKFIHTYISINLVGDIDSYVTVYNSIKDNCFLLLFTIKQNKQSKFITLLKFNKLKKKKPTRFNK